MSKDIIPNFESDIPDFLLHDASEKDKWLYKNLSRTSKMVDWLAEEQSRQSEKLDAINSQVQKTNGRTTQNEKDISDIKNSLGNFDRKESDFYVTVHKISKSKWAWIGLSFCLCFFTFGVVPFINSNGGISEFLSSAIKYFLG